MSQPSPGTPPFPIVGIGASAGGLEAFSQLLGALSRDTGMAYVLVQHLDPKHASQLPEVLARTTPMPVVPVTQGVRVEPNRVYVIPPNASMTIAGGVLSLAPRISGDRVMVIDRFFSSLAETHDGLAIGVVLSGTGSDGTIGLRAIKAKGGLTFAQDEKSAKHSGMPQSAAAVADSVLLPAAIGHELMRIAGHSYSKATAPAAKEVERRTGDNGVESVLRVLRTATGVDFSRYKAATVRRRIARRMFLQKLDDMGEYVRRLRDGPGEAQALRDEILVQVTGFFRDPEGFEALRQSVFPALVKKRTAEAPIRIWVPGCATGEEAYSLMIVLLEFLSEEDLAFPIQMFATDLSPTAIAKARGGVFPASIESEVSPERLRRFFVKEEGRFRISKTIRDACVFAQHDVTRDPPFSRLDLISCCNLLIYLDGSLQERVVPVFHYALKPVGFLKLGPSETVGRFTNLFSALDKKHKIYVSKAGPSAYLGFDLPAADPTATPTVAPPRVAVGASQAIEREADRLILARHTPAGVVVNADMEIVQVRGRTGPYLEPTPGAASLSVFKMAREGLQAPLRRAVQQAINRGGEPVRTQAVRVRTNGGSREVSVEVIPLGTGDDATRRHHLILFVDALPGPMAPTSKKPARAAARPRTALERQVAQLERELAEARRDLEATTQEHEATVEELRASTEEAQSSNEELQSTNEELETSKEELQATNEELTTVNDELNSRNAELRELSDDVVNLLASTHIPIIMVTGDRRVRRITPATERVLNVAPSDIGRPIGELRLSVDVPDLETLLREVMETLTVKEREVRARDGRWYSVRVRPYRTADNRIDGAVIAYVDIDDLQRGLEAATAARDQAQAIVETVREPLVILHEFRVVTANRAFYTTFQVTREQTERQSIFELGNRQWDTPLMRTLLDRVLSRDEAFEDVEIDHEFERIGRRTMIVNARRVLSVPGQPPQILLAIEDVTEARRLLIAQTRLQEQEQIARAQADANRAKDRFLAVLSHELRTPLNAVVGWSRMLRSKKLDPTATEQAMEVIERNATLQARLIEDLLDVSRIVSGTMKLDTRLMRVEPAVRAIVTTMQPDAEAKGVKLETSLAERAGTLRGDPARLQQIVGNLLSNAIKFTPRGGRIDVRLARRDSTAEISVADTGDGIAPERLSGIFDSFATHSTTRSHGGLGLGLTIVRQLAELHGGTVKAESAGLRQGARFTVTLPVTDEQSDDDAETGVVPAPVTTGGRRTVLEGIRVLVVDDEADARELLRAILAEHGASVTVAAKVRAAMALLEAGSFDVLVSDIAMPGEDGYDLIRKVRALDARHGGRIPALALTAYARPEDRAAAIGAGYQEHAAKPIEPDALAALVASLAGRARPELGGYQTV